MGVCDGGEKTVEKLLAGSDICPVPQCARHVLVDEAVHEHIPDIPLRLVEYSSAHIILVHEYA